MRATDRRVKENVMDMRCIEEENGFVNVNRKAGEAWDQKLHHQIAGGGESREKGEGESTHERKGSDRDRLEKWTR